MIKLIRRRKQVHEMVRLDLSGDTQIATWDPRDTAEVERVRKDFARIVADGFLPVRADKPTGCSGVKMREFDPTVKRIIFVPPLAGG